MRRTQRAVKQVLTERFYSWRDAEAVAKNDPEINLSGSGPLYQPVDFIEDEPSIEIAAESEVKHTQIPTPNASRGGVCVQNV